MHLCECEADRQTNNFFIADIVIIMDDLYLKKVIISVKNVIKRGKLL